MSKAYQVVRDFEKAIAEYTGAPYAVSVESCSAALLLCYYYRKFTYKGCEVEIPRYTYPSVANGLVHMGFKIKFNNWEWQKTGRYVIRPLGIIDSAKRFSRGMYDAEVYSSMMCLSFHGKKCLKIGRGGMILTSSEDERDFLKAARFDGRHECTLPGDKLEMPGFNCYMTPSQAARGLELLQWAKDENIEEPDEYNDLSQYEFYTKANR